MTVPTPSGPSIRAAGGVVTRRRGAHREFLIIHRARYDDWSLPKGKLDKREKSCEAAVREIEEETGTRTQRLARLGSIAYNTHNTDMKLVRYWLFEHVSGTFRPNNEVDEIRWLAAAEARRMLTYPPDRDVLEWGATLADRPRAGRVHLVRHARAGRRTEWKLDDKIRPLTKVGRRQAIAIALSLTATPIGRVLSSPYDRCMQTVAPLGSAIDEIVREEPLLAEGASTRSLVKSFTALEGKSVVMSSHGAEIEKLLDRLTRSGAHIDPRPKMQSEKGSIWELHLAAGRVTAARYIPAPTPT